MYRSGLGGGVLSGSAAVRQVFEYAVALLGGRGGPPRVTPSRGDTRMKLKNVAEFRKKHWRNDVGSWEDGICDETQKKCHHFLQRAMTK